MNAYLERRVRKFMYVPEDEKPEVEDVLCVASLYAFVCLEWLLLAIGIWLAFYKLAFILIDALYAVLAVLLIVATWELMEKLWDRREAQWKQRRLARGATTTPKTAPTGWPYGSDTTAVYDPRKPQVYDPQADIPTRLMKPDHPTLVFNAYDYAPTDYEPTEQDK